MGVYPCYFLPGAGVFPPLSLAALGFLTFFLPLLPIWDLLECLIYYLVVEIKFAIMDIPLLIVVAIYRLP